jgi:hypothetical protein
MPFRRHSDPVVPDVLRSKRLQPAEVTPPGWGVEQLPRLELPTIGCAIVTPGWDTTVTLSPVWRSRARDSAPCGRRRRFTWAGIERSNSVSAMAMSALYANTETWSGMPVPSVSQRRSGIGGLKV